MQYTVRLICLLGITAMIGLHAAPTGGMTARLLPWISGGEFRRRFESKGRFEMLMRTIPTMAITHAQAGLLGAAACALGRHG